MVEAYVVFKGKVQGVFFRKTVFHHTKNFPISGFIKNLLDGSVEAVFQGEKNEIEKLVALIKEKPALANLTEVHMTYRKPLMVYPDFSIEY